MEGRGCSLPQLHCYRENMTKRGRGGSDHFSYVERCGGCKINILPKHHGGRDGAPPGHCVRNAHRRGRHSAPPGHCMRLVHAHLDLIRAPYGVCGVKYIDLVSLGNQG